MYILTIFPLFLIWILTTILILSSVLLILVPIKAFFNFNFEEPKNFQLIIRWMNALLKSTINKNDDTTTINVYVFNLKILSKSLKGKNGSFSSYFKLLKSLNPSFLKINASYGFVDPSITGMVFGAAELVCDHIQGVELSNNADFNTDYDYGKVYAMGTFRSIPTLKTLINYKNQSSLSPVLQVVK